MRKLQIAFSKKEKAQRLLTNLKQLQETEEVPAAQAETLNQKYSALLAEGTEEIEQITEKLSKQAEAARTRLELTSKEHEDLKVRIRVGELEEKRNARRLAKLEKTVERLSTELEQFENLLNATSSEALGGFLDIPLNRTKAGRKRT